MLFKRKWFVTLWNDRNKYRKLNVSRILLQLLESSITNLRYSPMKLKHPRKNSTGMPSALKLFPFQKSWRIRNSSSQFTSFINSFLCSIPTKLVNMDGTWSTSPIVPFCPQRIFLNNLILLQLAARPLCLDNIEPSSCSILLNLLCSFLNLVKF